MIVKKYKNKFINQNKYQKTKKKKGYKKLKKLSQFKYKMN